MARQRFAIAWIACLAVLFNAFAMPMASAMQQSQDPVQQLLWGSFCSSNGASLKTIALGQLEIPAPQQDDHSTMQHCWCCSGSAAGGNPQGVRCAWPYCLDTEVVCLDRSIGFDPDNG